jgi:SPASM domain peptide maturase of grasp-with-spasm system
VVTKGFLRSIIIDTQRSEYYFIPNELYDILITQNKVLFHDILREYGSENQEIINEYVTFLLEKDLAYFTTEAEAFPAISSDWTSPYQISNAIVDIDANSIYNISKAIKELDNLGCEALQIRIFCVKDLKFYYTLIEYLNQIKRLKTVEIVMPYDTKYILETHYGRILEKCILIHRLTVFNAPFTKEIFEKTGSILHFIKFNVSNESHCGNILKEFFTTDLQNINEGLHHNTCLNRKVSIDRFGNIKNCPSMKKSFGKIGEVKIKAILKDSLFTDVWNINKDQIKICTDCEFRSICTDCRAYIQIPSDIFSKPSKCKYNPYNATWEN